MRRSFAIVGCVLVLAVSASAQVSVPFSVYAGGAFSVPRSPDGFKDSYKTGLHGLVGLGYKMGPGFQLVGKVEYHKFSYDFGFFGVSDVTGGDTKIWMFGGDGRFSLGLPAAPIKPFVFAGVGLADVQQSDFGGNLILAQSLSRTFPEKQNRLYYNLGVGVELGGGPAFGFFAQVRYVSIATKGSATAFVPITVGLKFF